MLHNKVQAMHSIAIRLAIYSETTARMHDIVNVALRRSSLKAFPVCDDTVAVLRADLVA